MTRAMLAGLLLSATCAGAAPFADPTRPPASEAAPAAGSASGEGAPRLESVLIAPDRRIAVINGQAVRVGERIGEARVLRITETEVALREGKSTQILRLFPAAERHPAGRTVKGKKQ